MSILPLRISKICVQFIYLTPLNSEPYNFNEFKTYPIAGIFGRFVHLEKMLNSSSYLRVSVSRESVYTSMLELWSKWKTSVASIR